jgi:hypothetical protein
MIIMLALVAARTSRQRRWRRQTSSSNRFAGFFSFADNFSSCIQSSSDEASWMKYIIGFCFLARSSLFEYKSKQKREWNVILFGISWTFFPLRSSPSCEFKSAIEQQWDFEGASRFDFPSFEDFLEKTFLPLPIRPRWSFHCEVAANWMENFPRFMNFKLAISRRRIALDRDCNFHFSQLSLSLSHCSTTCGSNGIFSRRLDFSLYNVLPKQRINSIEVKVIMEIFYGKTF